MRARGAAYARRAGHANNDETMTTAESDEGYGDDFGDDSRLDHFDHTRTSENGSAHTGLSDLVLEIYAAMRYEKHMLRSAIADAAAALHTVAEATEREVAKQCDISPASFDVYLGNPEREKFMKTLDKLKTVDGQQKVDDDIFQRPTMRAHVVGSHQEPIKRAKRVRKTFVKHAKYHY